MREAVEIETEFIVESLPCRLLGLNSDMMTSYVQYIADRLLKQLGYGPIYDVPNCPLDFMERISITNKSNFFEVRVSEYSKANVGGGDMGTDRALKFDSVGDF
jgi:ribonucleotide reductase beta subunit family protein with ferritin-like domain